MGCSFSGLNVLYDTVSGGGDVWINENRFRIVRQLGEGGFAYVCLVKELGNDSSSSYYSRGGGLAKKVKDKSHLSDEGIYAMKKVLIQNTEQLELVREEIPLLDHAIISVKATREGNWKHEAYLQGDAFDPVLRHCSCRSGHPSIVQHLTDPLSFGIAQVRRTSMRGLIYGLWVAHCMQ